MSEAIQTPGESERLETLERRVDDLNNYFATAMQRIRDLEAENETLRERVTELEACVTPDPTGKAYADKTRPEKVREVRIALARKAQSQSGRARYTYRDVVAQFGSRPSAGHAYTLMEIAGETDGYRYGTHRDEKALRVDMADVNDDAVLHAVNNGETRKGGQN